MKLSFDEIFKHSDVLNPISPTTLFEAGKLAELQPNKVILDLGSGKGSPSILWASLFGVQVEGYDFDSDFVQYANSRAKMLNLSHHVRFYCKDVKELQVTRAYDVVASLGLGIVRTFGNIRDALKKLQTMLLNGGVLIFAEPVWLAKAVPSEVLEVLNARDATEQDFLTKSEIRQMMEECGFHVRGSFDSSKEDWELYIRPVNYAMSEVIESTSELAEEAQTIIKSFKAEYDAVNQYWDMVLWVAEAS